MTQCDRRLRERKAEVFNALAHPLRVAVAEFLRGGERCVCEIVAHVGAEQSNISRHLALMVRSGVLANRKKGLKVFYRVRYPCIFNFLRCVDGMLQDQLRETGEMLGVRVEEPARRTRTVRAGV